MRSRARATVRLSLTLILALVAACGGEPVGPDALAVEVHEVGDLTSPYLDPRSRYGVVQSLVDEVRLRVEPAYWDATEDADLRPFDEGTLLVRAAPCVQSAVRAYLDGLRRRGGWWIDGDDPPWNPRVPAWAVVAPLQIAEARRHGVPAAFENDLGMRFVLIPAGTFLMGSPHHEKGRDEDEEQQTVRLSRPFYLQTTEVTNGQFRLWKAEHDSDLSVWGYTLDGDEQPVHARFHDVRCFAAWASSRDPARDYRLPTEAEWEYACRAGTRGPTYWGASLDEAWRYENTRSSSSGGPLDEPDGYVTTAPVGSYLPNPWGLHDMLGNMDEWCADAYAPFPWSWTDVSAPVVDPTGPAATDQRVVRSSFCLASTDRVRCASRYGLDVLRKRAVAGIRLVSPLPDSGP